MAATKAEIAARIRERREYLHRTRRGGFQQQEVAERVGLGRVGYNHYETGKNDISATMLARIAEVLDVPVAWLLGEAESEWVTEHDLMTYYRGMPPILRPAAEAALRAMYEASDLVEDQEEKAESRRFAQPIHDRIRKEKEEEKKRDLAG